LGLIAVVWRTQASAPGQAYVPSGIENPRKWFILSWLIGLVASFIFKARVVADIKPSYAVTIVLASVLVLSGGLWCLRWFSNKIVQDWPHARLDAPAVLPLRWPPNWWVVWSIVGGVLTAALAFGLEIYGLKLFAPLIASATERILLAPSGSGLNDPAVVILIILGIAIVAPLIEELCKALALLLFRKSIDRPIDGLMLGMAIGIGFGLVESAFYLVGLINAWWIAAWLRLATILMHGTTTSIIGRAYALSRRTGRRRDLIAGYLRAVLLHGLWNGLVIGAALIALNGQAILGCGGLIFWLLLMSRQLPRIATAGVEASVQDEYAAAEQPLPSEWSPLDNGLAWKLVGSEPKYYNPVTKEQLQ
ncbi:MAG TPA: PrsW family glutamic-type intramembrane protease, partial [Anaerolineae bacterium]|nr:PrsW family glutamic-type intramembrane protease [Anaerolineae bacterium]